MKFLLDTNFLMIPRKFKVDIFEELKKFGIPELYTIDLVVKELEKINNKESLFALVLIDKYKIKVIETSGRDVDKTLREVAKDDFIVCTQDKGLIQNLKKDNTRIISLRQMKYLEER